MTIISAIVPLSKDKGDPIAEIIGVVLIPDVKENLFITTTNPVLYADGNSTSEITIKVEDKLGNPCQDVTIMLDIIPEGSEYGSLEITNLGDDITNEKGEINVFFRAGTILGKVKIRAKIISDSQIDDGLYQFSIGEYITAEEMFKNAKADFPQDNHSDDVNYMLGKTYEYLNENNEAIINYNELVEYYLNGPWANDTLYRIGQIYAKIGDYENAISTFKKLINNEYLKGQSEVYKNNLKDNSLFRLGNLYEREKNYELAKQAYQNIIDTYSNSNENYFIDAAKAALERIENLE